LIYVAAKFLGDSSQLILIDDSGGTYLSQDRIDAIMESFGIDYELIAAFMVVLNVHSKTCIFGGTGRSGETSTIDIPQSFVYWWLIKNIFICAADNEEISVPGLELTNPQGERTGCPLDTVNTIAEKMLEAKKKILEPSDHPFLHMKDHFLEYHDEN